MVSDETIEKALDAALKADIIPMDDPKHDGVRVHDYLQYTAADAVELGVLLTYKNDDGSPRFCRITDIAADEHEDTHRAILKPCVKAAVNLAISAHGKQHMPMGIAVVAGAYLMGVATVLVVLWSNGVFS